MTVGLRKACNPIYDTDWELAKDGEEPFRIDPETLYERSIALTEVA